MSGSDNIAKTKCQSSFLGRLLHFNYWRTRNEPEITNDMNLSSNKSKSSLKDTEIEFIDISGAIIKSGYLSKKIWRFGHSTSYFVLRNNGKLCFYKNEIIAKDRKKYKGFTNVKDIYIVPKGLKEFIIYTKKSIWYLKAKTSQDRDDWIKKLKSIRAFLRMKEEEELKRILNPQLNQQKKINTKKIITEMDETLQITYKNLRELEVKLNDFRHSLLNGKQFDKIQMADIDDTSHKIIKDIQISLQAIKRYFIKSKSLQNEMKRIIHDLNYESQQRSNLIRQIELQAKQLNCIEKSARLKSNFASEELTKLNDLLLATESESEREMVGISSWQEINFSETGTSESVKTEHTPSTIKKKTSLSAMPVVLRAKQRMRKRRTQIPQRKKTEMSLWSLLKNALGKELYKIPLPVNFNEPLSFIQRLTECLEYSNLIDKAAKIQNSADQMIYVATFVISTLCNTVFRTCKPFNPLWCETFEFDRMADLGWRAIAEQVSHHPPISAIHAEGNGWILDEDIDVHSQFQATIMKIYPEGTASIFFPETKSFFYWTMKDIKTFVKGFIIGPITVHNEGNCVIMSKPDGINCVLNLIRHKFFSIDNERIFSGTIYDKFGKELYCLSGDWSQKCQIIWTRNVQPKESELMYNYTALAIELNEPEDDVAPTDSRLRPDMRMMENGNWNAANEEKKRLEEKQRIDTKKYQDMLENGEKIIERPIWFKKCFDHCCGTSRYLYQEYSSVKLKTTSVEYKMV
ncbi:Uncharacterized protein BM_BM8299 [Brugia malayi]|uniref:Oxysterol-binding protein n=1 Tax=Brugia malayi TaxID=6279 RepID=A0A4E9F973_BRUMA|nr:Uncharacterized protein BM_BM8299 [Brugia malayi]VIO92582.1 Uncharacterized protein BM_BM8299 [Brugia malayi]